MSGAAVKLCLVVAMAANRVIGRDNALPWRLPEDLRHFKALTLGKPVIMGRRTFESIGRALPGRSNIVLSTVSGFAPSADVIVTRDLPTALGLAREIATRDGVGECMVIGGAEIYRQCLRFADRIYLTQIELEIAGDTWFPEIDPRQWRESERVPGQSAAEPGLRFCFVTLERLPAVAGRAI
ncbi:MAG: dihydrofolate reductase [Gammaproteobacteria bacterium]|jgi:dihydrofolate reductase|nr:dihydrofolate reductase [Gammaproteobacteria bacterium]MBP6051474.1 dihydrofolate reductase [Pseudomonadales bacterium]MBK6582754.1 dihydrofolate reductase [Gammaproteobacteria bacterium]MBK7171248.1 dihydrofolate reductase [Gammaproteobacteria bacterium]MBK7518883.1 dihydrofolate reductase [Gammaproteobacteria bacterium]